MSRVLGPNWRDQLLAMASEANEEVFVVVPYFTAYGVSLLLSSKKPEAALRVLVGCSCGDFVSGVCDYESLVKLVQTASEVRHLLGIHAKVFVFDSKKAVITSSNLSMRGIETNLELGIYIDDREHVRQLLQIVKPFWSASKLLTAARLPRFEDVRRQLQAQRATLIASTETTSTRGSDTLGLLDELFTETEGVTRQIIMNQTGSVRVHRDAKEILATLLADFDEERMKKREKLVSRLQPQLARHAIRRISEGELRDILEQVWTEFGQIWRRSADLVLRNPLPRIRAVLEYLLWGSDEVEQRLENLLYDDSWYLKGARLGFLSTMLFVKSPGRYPLYNQWVRKGLESLVRGASFEDSPEGYLNLTTVLTKFKREYRIPDVAVDWVLWKRAREVEAGGAE